MKLNKKPDPIFTHEGAKAQHINAEQQLSRAVMACMLWENEFYEDGQSIAKRITGTISQVKPEAVAQIAMDARSKMKLRHIPLLIAREMARLPEHKKLVAQVLMNIIQRPDELSEFLALYWKDKKQPLSKQVKKGLAGAFNKFDAYQLAKYNRDNAIKLRDVLFLCHAKPVGKEQGEVWKKLIDGTLETPDTWEVALSSGGDKKEHWTRLLQENKLGALALLRNLRNMEEAKVNGGLITGSLEKMKVERVLPFRFLVAANHAPRFESSIENAFFRCSDSQEKLPGKTVLIVDVSGSMYGSRISKYSEMDRASVACSLAVLIRDICETPAIYATAGNDSTRVHKTQIVPTRRGFALRDAIHALCRPLGGGGIFLKQVMEYAGQHEDFTADRVIVITDEQDCDISGSPASAKTWGSRNYMINVASNKNGIGYGAWTHIDGFSEAVIDYIREYERSFNGPTRQD